MKKPTGKSMAAMLGMMGKGKAAPKKSAGRKPAPRKRVVQKAPPMPPMGGGGMPPMGGGMPPMGMM